MTLKDKMRDIIEVICDDFQKEIREDVESVDVDAKAFTRTSDVDGALANLREKLIIEFVGKE